MKLRTVLLVALLGLTLSGCSTLTGFSNDKASGYRHFTQEQCVPYARRISGINLRGDAHTWWTSAAGVYQRGQQPIPGSILVLSRTNKLRHGHLAVVTDVLTPRTINVTHTNWGNDWISRRVTYQTHRVEDVSPANNWTSVRFWNNEVDAYGFPYKADGFIYNQRY